MANWRSSAAIALSLLVFRYTAVFVLGVYLWYLILTFKDIEARLVTRRMRWRAAHIPYLVARYANLCELLTMVISSHAAKRKIYSCLPTEAAVRLTAMVGNLALAAASTNLAFRVIVLWKNGKGWIVRLLIAVCAMHSLLAMLFGAFSIDAIWDTKHNICIISPAKTQPGLLSLYCFTLAWNFVILILTAIGIRRSPLPRDSPLSAMLYQQSLGYAIVTCLTCIPMAIVVSLNLNSIMNVIPAIIGTTVTVITSSSAVTSLLRLNDPDDSICRQESFSAARANHHRRGQGQRQGRAGRVRLNIEGSNDDGSGKSSSFAPYSSSFNSEELHPVGELTTHINLGSTSELHTSQLEEAEYGVWV